MNMLEYVISFLLTLDTVRALIAMLGYVKPESKYAWLFYGRYERNLVRSAMKELGFREEKTYRILNNINKIANCVEDDYGVTGENAAIHLIILLAKYIIKFRQPIQYGKKIVNSNYYINTMEISHNEEDRQIMAAIMVHLINANIAARKKPQVVFSPKEGNPLFVQELARVLNADFVAGKSPRDNSKVSAAGIDSEELFKVNYEGAGLLERKIKEYNYIVMDCNTSSGSHLLEIIKDIRQVYGDGRKITVFVLFRADSKEDIDTKFKNRNSQLYRFFDLEEETKQMLFDMKCRCEKQHRVPSAYNEEDVSWAKEILDKMRKENKLYYEPDEIYVGGANKPEEIVKMT